MDREEIWSAKLSHIRIYVTIVVYKIKSRRLKITLMKSEDRNLVRLFWRKLAESFEIHPGFCKSNFIAFHALHIPAFAAQHLCFFLQCGSIFARSLTSNASLYARLADISVRCLYCAISLV